MHLGGIISTIIIFIYIVSSSVEHQELSQCNVACSYIVTYYISQIVRMLWFVNLAGRILLHDSLKFKVVLLPICSVIYYQEFVTFIASKLKFRTFFHSKLRIKVH